MVQDRKGISGKESVVNERLEDINGYLVQRTWSGTPKTHKVNNRIAAYMAGQDRVAYTMQASAAFTPRWTTNSARGSFASDFLVGKIPAAPSVLTVVPGIWHDLRASRHHNEARFVCRARREACFAMETLSPTPVLGASAGHRIEK